MKKKVTVLLTALLAAGLIGGCGNGGSKDQADSTEGTTSTEGTIAAVYPKDLDLSQYVTLGEYKGLTYNISAKVQYTEEEVMSNAFSMYSGFVTAETGGITDRAAQLGDTVNIDYAGTKDGVAFSGGTATNQQLALGSGQFIEGFEEGLVGVNPGETVDLNLTFPEGYNEELGGADVVFTVTVNFIYPTDVASMTDDAVVASMGNSDITTVQGLIDFTRTSMESYAENIFKNEKETTVFSGLIDAAEISEAPEELVKYHNASLYNSMVQEAAQYYTDADTYCNYYYGMDATTYASTYATDSAKQHMVVQTLAEKENLAVTDEDVEAWVQETAEVNNVTADEVRNQIDVDALKISLLFEKVLAFLVENNTFVEG